MSWKSIRTKKLYHTYKWHTTKFKVTVKLKGKQDLAGLKICTIQGLYNWKKGNKTTYSQKFQCRGKKKGKKITVKIYGARYYEDGYFSNFTETYKKKVKVR